MQLLNKQFEVKDKKLLPSSAIYWRVILKIEKNS